VQQSYEQVGNKNQTDVLGAIDRSLAYANHLTGSELFTMSKWGPFPESWGRKYPEYLDCRNQKEDYECVQSAEQSDKGELHTYEIRGRGFVLDGTDDRGGRGYTRMIGVVSVSSLGLGGFLLYAILLSDGPLPLRQRSRTTGPVPRTDTFDHRRRASPAGRPISRRGAKTDVEARSPSAEGTPRSVSGLASSAPVPARSGTQRRQSPSRVASP
jgi:hypothetical protein